MSRKRVAARLANVYTADNMVLRRSGDDDEGPGTREDMVLIRVTKEEKRVLTEAARREGLGLSSWLRQLGLRASRRGGR